MGFRQETDSMGDIDVPADAYYGAFTVRARSNFQLTGRTVHPALIQSIAKIKEAAAQTNNDLGLLDDEKAEAISLACDEVVAGSFSESFVLDEIQAGAGTATHMNVNEVIANRATEELGGGKGDYIVHPNDHVNMGQSTNNVVPTALRLSVLALFERVTRQLTELEESFAAKAEAFKDIIKVGRTHLQDAVPVRLGQEFNAYATSTRKARERIERPRKEMTEVGIGGNAIGTGINTPKTFRNALVSNLEDVTGYGLEPTTDPVQMTQSMTPFETVADALKAFASEFIKIADDLMLLSSGPVAGIGELRLPEVEPGSSIMPGKINPSIVEAFKMGCIQVKANADAVSRCSEHGDLDMNVFAPLIAKNLLEALEIVASASRMLREKCINGIEADEDRIQELFEGSTATATALSPYIGYHRTAKVVKQALADDRSIAEEVVRQGLLTEDEVEQILDPERLTAPHGIDTGLRQTIQERLEEEE